MNEHLPATKVAERMLTAASGATMDEIIAATGGAQYNLLRRLEAKGYKIRKTKEGRATRYRAIAPVPGYELKVSDKGQVTLPKELREKTGVHPGRKVRVTVENGKVVISSKTGSIRDLFGILGKPPSGKHLKIGQMDKVIAQAAVDRYLGAIGRRK